MRFLLLIFLLRCSTPLKYKYSSSKRYLASLTDESIKVAKIELSLKDSVLFASGMDSTFLIVKLFDAEGALITTIDPSDLTISSSEDLEAKPFAMKQGVYKAAILPNIKSPSIQMQVDWQDKVKSDFITLKTTLAPLKGALLPLHHEYNESRSHEEVNISRGSAAPETSTEAFSFVNVGENSIVTKSDSSRTFSFEYPEQASQNLSMQIDDSPNDTVSHTMHSIFMFFPRKQLPLVEQLASTMEVTLPTGEKIIFQKESKEIVTGVFEEGPVDIGPDRFKRQYADLKYKGSGVVLRVNARGQSPQLGQFENVKIDMDYGIKGSSEVLIYNGATGQRCRRPKSDFWEPLDVSPIEFKFATDKEFDQYLKAKCGFSLPKL
jgi:hypothetical protein